MTQQMCACDTRLNHVRVRAMTTSNSRVARVVVPGAEIFMTLQPVGFQSGNLRAHR